MRKPVAETITRSLENFTRERILKATLLAAVENGCPVAFWRLPHTEELHVIVSFAPARELGKVDLEELQSGFMLSPFDTDNSSQLFIDGDLHISFDFGEVSTQFDFNKEKPSRKEEHFIDSFFAQLEADKTGTDYHLRDHGPYGSLPDYPEYVQQCVNEIKLGSVQKVVPARFKEVPLTEDFDAISLLLALGHTYPNAFVSLVSVPQAGTWMGATPEVLIEQEGNVFKTVALAATQKRNPEKPISETAWTQKEIEEQAMVSRYIINCFKKIRLREFDERGPKTTVAGNLLHLKTEYAVNTADTNFPELGTVMLELLHPTSAVAGMPKEAALGIIRQHEGFDREYFSGFLGPVHIDDHTNVFVNLRCMQLLSDKARLYAGAGVTEDSDPQKEYQETEIKFNTLLNVMQQNP